MIEKERHSGGAEPAGEASEPVENGGEEKVLAPCEPAEQDESEEYEADTGDSAAQLKDQLLRALAETENIRRRARKDVPDATRYGVMVANVPDYCRHEVSDHALGLWLTLARKIAFADRQVRQGEWGMKPLEPVSNLRFQTAGIIGLGRIGRLAARKLAAFGAELLFTDPYVSGELYLSETSCRVV